MGPALPPGGVVVTVLTASRLRIAKWTPCWHSGTVEVVAHKVQNGAVHLRAYCSHCLKLGNPIPHMQFSEDERALVRLYETSDPVACGHCGRTDRGVALHHWAPRKLFVDADEWPTSYLCEPCHRFWHGVIAAAQKHNGETLTPPRRVIIRTEGFLQCICGRPVGLEDIHRTTLNLNITCPSCKRTLLDIRVERQIEPATKEEDHDY